eukprot:1153944-Pelagomonas_calceolata.AAC.2
MQDLKPNSVVPETQNCGGATNGTTQNCSGAINWTTQYLVGPHVTVSGGNDSRKGTSLQGRTCHMAANAAP